MLVAHCMTRGVRLAAPGETIEQAARVMAMIDAGILPVGENDRLVGVITDRDIAVRAVARGKGPDAMIRDIMSSKMLYCYEDEDVADVLANMGEVQVRRLPVVNRNKELVGIVSLSDCSGSEKSQTGEALRQIARPGGEHSQGANG